MPIIGLDLGRHTIRAVEIEKSKGKAVLEKCGVYDNSHLNIDSDSKEDNKNYSEAIKHFFSEMGFDTPNVVVSLPEYNAFIRIIKVPKMSEKELRSSIEYEAEQYIPFPIKEMNISYQVVDNDFKDPNLMEVMLVAAKKDILNKYINLLREAGLVPRALEPETLSLSRVLGKSGDGSHASIILNVGFTNTLIIATYKGYVRLARNIPIGGDTFTRSIQQKLNLDYMQAEEYKKAYGLESNQAEGKVFEAIKPVFENIISEVKRSDIFFTTHNSNVSINRVVISGGTALMPGLLTYMASNLDTEVELANPWKDIRLLPKLESQKDIILENGPVYSVAVGLALKEI